MDVSEVLLRELRLHLHLAAFGEPEQRAGARADDLSDLDVARRISPEVGATTLSWPICARVAPSWAWATLTCA